ncbi:hypothetical protein [Nocardia farcinica]|uniref:hypothetical protein n=1 Tax=Nocardia farcinica TaxID=37329 RepID=UPI002454EDB6|nr:hypothetical protein [Nocardia farcinica]
MERADGRPRLGETLGEVAGVEEQVPEVGEVGGGEGEQFVLGEVGVGDPGAADEVGQLLALGDGRGTTTAVAAEPKVSRSSSSQASWCGSAMCRTSEEGSTRKRLR